MWRTRHRRRFHVVTRAVLHVLQPAQPLVYFILSADYLLETVHNLQQRLLLDLVAHRKRVVAGLRRWLLVLERVQHRIVKVIKTVVHCLVLIRGGN